ncbi:MAG: nitrogenase iron protein [Deltaproteobacteria bacterium]|nr:MAG: nitrogenase iron protein [Deltaproteobacteria bacterium]
MKTIAIYGKGGSGKSTVAANLSVQFARRGLKTLQIGCDPKHDSTRLLMGGKRIETVIDMIEKGFDEGRDEFKKPLYLKEGLEGIGCIETGGPESGKGCAGLGIVSAFRLLGRHKVLEQYEVILMDVLGDVVCGGFAMPLSRGISSGVVIVVGDTIMSLYAANNIAKAIVHYQRNGARLLGLVVNATKEPGRLDAVRRFAAALGAEILEIVPYDDVFAEAERTGLPVSAMQPDCTTARKFEKLSGRLLEARGTVPCPMDDDSWERFLRETT